MNAALLSVVIEVVKAFVGSETFVRIEARVMEWMDKKIDGAAKRHGVMDDLEVIGLKVSEQVVRMVIELVVLKANELRSSKAL